MPKRRPPPNPALTTPTRARNSQLRTPKPSTASARRDQRFEAQQSRWDEPHPKRTGIPQSDYHHRLQALRVVPPRPISNTRLDCSVTQDKIDERESAHAEMPHVLVTAFNYSGSLSAVKKEIRVQAKAYMRLFSVLACGFLC